MRVLIVSLILLGPLHASNVCGTVLEKSTGERFQPILRKRLNMFSVDDFTTVTPSRVRPYRKKVDSTWENAPIRRKQQVSRWRLALQRA